MNKRPANRDGKSIPKANGDQSVPAIAKAKTKYGQLVGIVVLCSSVCLLAAYLFPYPEDSLLSKEEPQVKSEFPLEQANTVGVLAEKSSLTLPKESLYTDSSQEKKRLLNEVEKAVEAYPNDASILHIAGLVYAELQQSERALELLQKCNEIDSNRSDVVVALADQFTQLGKHNEATLVLEQAIGRGLETEPLLSAMGEIYSQAGKMEEAANVLERAVALASADPMVSHKSQSPLRLLGNGNKETLSYAKIAVERLGTIDAYLVLMDASRASGDTASAYNAYLKAKAIAPNDPRLATFKP